MLARLCRLCRAVARANVTKTKLSQSFQVSIHVTPGERNNMKRHVRVRGWMWTIAIFAILFTLAGGFRILTTNQPALQISVVPIEIQTGSGG